MKTKDELIYDLKENLEIHKAILISEMANSAKMQKNLEKAVEALRFYANKNNWMYTGEYTFDDVDPYWWDVHKSITGADLEEHNATMKVAGKTAREILKEIGAAND